MGVEPCECQVSIGWTACIVVLSCIISCFPAEFRSLLFLCFTLSVCITAPCYFLTLTMYRCHCTLYLYLPSLSFGLLLSSLLSFSPPVFLSSGPSTMLSPEFRDLGMVSTRTRIIIMLTNVLLRFFLPSAFVSIRLLPNDKEYPCTSSSSCHRVERRMWIMNVTVTTRRCVG